MLFSSSWCGDAGGREREFEWRGRTFRKTTSQRGRGGMVSPAVPGATVPLSSCLPPASAAARTPLLCSTLFSRFILLTTQGLTRLDVEHIGGREKRKTINLKAKIPGG